MTRQDLDILLKYPERLTADVVSDLKELSEHYPYFAPARALYLRALKLADSVLFERELARTAVYAHDRRWLYFFLYPEQKEDVGRKYVRSSSSSGDYFDMLSRVEREGEDVGQSLKALAERLKRARMDVVGDVEEKPEKETVSQAAERGRTRSVRHPAAQETEGGPDEDYAGRVRLLIREKKYEEALAILKELNLNNPKKSIYFADQIRFVEKIIDNINK